MIQNNRYCKAKQAALNADATRKRQRCNQRDPPRYVSSYTYHIVMLPLLRVHFFTGNHYVYKGGASAQTVTEGQDVTSWSALSPGSAITLTGSPATITVVEADAAGKAVKAGSVTAVYGS